MNEQVEKIVQELNQVMTKLLVERTKGKRVLLDLSGGNDTRVNLAMLLKNNIEFTAYTYNKNKGDIEIASKIAKKYHLKHILSLDTDLEMKKKKRAEVIKDFDVVISAHGFTETLNALHELNRPYNTCISLVTNQKNTDVIFSPILEKDALDLVKKIPIGYLLGATIQKKLIAMNVPELLKFRFTYYDWRHYLLNTFYPSFADFIFNSYYRGKGREFGDVKKDKDRWWEAKGN
jgi:hypothetical protein